MNTEKLFHLFSAIKEWKLKRTKKLNKKQYNNGYDLATGALLRKEETPCSLTTDYLHFRAWSYFDDGVNDAINYLVNKGLIEDNRIYRNSTQKFFSY